MFLFWLFTKIAKMAPKLRAEKQKQKTPKKPFKQLHLDQWPNFKIFSQICSSYALVPKLLKWFRLAERAKNRKKA